MQNDVTLAWIGVVGLIGVAVVTGVFAIINEFVKNSRNKKTDDRQPDAVVGLAFSFDPMKELIQEKDERLEDAQKEIKSLKAELDATYRERNSYLRQLYAAGVLPVGEWVRHAAGDDTLGASVSSETEEESE